MKTGCCSLVLAGLAALALSCADGKTQGDAGQGPQAAPEALSEFKVVSGSPDLLFQYFDPTTGKPETTQDPSKVPEGARKSVIVFSKALKKGDLPASQIIVADLTSPGPDGSFPYALVSRYSVAAPAAAGPSGPAAGGLPATGPAADTVLVFATQWCPHCREAIQWLAANNVPFKEMDVEADPSARALLSDLGRKSNTPESMLSTVPILYVRGQLVLGFNAGQVAGLLGK
jgi:glutaredoxin